MERGKIIFLCGLTFPEWGKWGSVYGLSAEDGLWKILNTVYHTMARQLSPMAWLTARVLMGEQPQEVLNWKSEPNVDRRNDLKNLYVDMIHMENADE